jgi:hypothetical protein
MEQLHDMRSFDSTPRQWRGLRPLVEVVRKAYVGSDGSSLITFEQVYDFPLNNIGVQHIDGQQMFPIEISK